MSEPGFTACETQLGGNNASFYLRRSNHHCMEKIQKLLDCVTFVWHMGPKEGWRYWKMYKEFKYSGNE